jgi:hypothetical protein
MTGVDALKTLVAQPEKETPLTMSYYCLFDLVGSGPIRRLAEFHAEDDETAVSLAEARRDTRAMQLWCRGRKVKEWPSDNSRQPA